MSLRLSATVHGFKSQIKSVTGHELQQFEFQATVHIDDRIHDRNIKRNVFTQWQAEVFESIDSKMTLVSLHSNFNLLNLHH